MSSAPDSAKAIAWPSGCFDNYFVRALRTRSGLQTSGTEPPQTEAVGPNMAFGTKLHYSAQVGFEPGFQRRKARR